MKKILFIIIAIIIPEIIVPAQTPNHVEHTSQPQQQSKPESKMPQFDLDQYQFALLKRGPKWTAEKTPETEKIQAGHMANIQKMAKLGKLMAAGPIGDKGDLAGIFIFKASSIEEAKALAAEDPAIQAGRLVMEIHPWMGPKGIGQVLIEAFQKDPNMKMTMTTYYLALLGKGAKQADSSTPGIQQLQLDHLWNVRRMLDAKTFAAAGPFVDNGNLRGIFVIAAKSVDEAKAIADADPMVKAGYLAVEIHPWLVAKEVWP